MNENTVFTSVVASPLAIAAPLPLAEHPAAVYLSRLAFGSRRTMQQALDAMASLLTNGSCDAMTLDWAALRYKHTAALRAVLIEKYAPATANKMLSALRGVLKEALRLELMDVKDYTRAVDISNIKASKELRGRALNEEEIAILMQMCYDDPTSAGYRDAALIAVLRGTGMRRSEVVNLNLSDFDSSTGAMKVWGGKGGKDRTVYLPMSGIPILEDWLGVRGEAPGPVFCHVNKAGRVVVRRLTPQAVRHILTKRAASVVATQQQQQPEHSSSLLPFSSHDFRRTFVSELLDVGVDISTVQKLAGHADIATTARYDRRGEETKRRAVQSLSIPSSRKKS